MARRDNGNAVRKQKPSLALAGKRDEVLAIAKRYGAYNVRVFGSVARGEDTSRSDLDILVDMEDERSIWDLAGLLADLTDALDCRVQVVESAGLHKLLKDRILSEATPL